MDKLDSNPNPKESYHPSILAAMKFARKKLNHYYSLTDLSAVYRIAMGKFKHFIYILNTHSMTVLHPALKLEYFCQHEWEEDWIDTALQLVQDEYTARYEKALPAEESPVATKPTPTNDFADFLDFSVATKVTHTSELDNFLRDPVEAVKDPLLWWYNKRLIYPNLSSMARDYLSIPPTSTAVERVFSQGRGLLQYTRNRLSPDTIRAYLCLGDWCRNGVVDISDLTAAIKEKKRKYIAIDED